MIEVKQLTGFKIDLIHEAFSRAFSDYVEPFDLTRDQLQYMIERRGCDLNLSFGAFHGDELVGFTLNGIGQWNGKLTAYDTGTGIVKEYRKKGIATKIFNESLPVLKENNVHQYLLEVIRSNISAFELYKKAGFKVVREFDYYKTEKNKLTFTKKMGDVNFRIEEINNPDWNLLKALHDFQPSWQNSIDSINRKIRHFKILGIFSKNNLAGYGIIEKETGDISQFAIAKEYRRAGAGTLLFKSLVKLSGTNRIKIINTDSSYEPFKKFAESINLPPGIGQYEMILQF